jgi:thiol-disulfide isomerase/thioredoxin
MKRITTIVAVAALVLAGSAHAGKFNKVINIGDKMPSFSGLEAVSADGKTIKVSADDFKDKDVVVICVTCNHCPVAQAYEDRLVEFAKKYAGKDSKVGFIAVNCNVTDAKAASDDNFEKMIERSKQKGFTFPYAIDTTQKLGRDLGATITPEFFVFDKDRKLVYMGVMDDSQNKPKVNYLNPAVEAALKGQKPEVQETDIAGRGCSVKYSKK